MKLVVARSWVAAFALVFMFPAGPTLPAAAETPEWSKAELESFGALSQPNATMAGLVRSIARQTPTSGQEAMFQASLFLRAGMNERAIQSFRELRRLCPELDESAVSSIYYVVGDQRHAWDVAQAICEIFADRIADITLENRLIKHMQETGWSAEQIDAWLAARPQGIRNFWVKERLRFNAGNERAIAIEKQLAERVRANPTDASEAIAYLDALAAVPRAPQLATDRAWMADVVRPQFATQAERIAELLSSLNARETAAKFYRMAIEIPLTDEDLHELSRMSQAAMPGTIFSAIFAARVRDSLAKCLVEMNQADEAQKWMVEAADIREKHKIESRAFLAGEVQAASGAREIESRIVAAEAANEDDPKYWNERAAYFRGRKEAEQEEQALKKGLALSAPLPQPERKGKGAVDWRSQFLSEYARFLVDAKRENEAVALLRRELADAPVEALSSERAAYLLGHGIWTTRSSMHFEPKLDPNDKVVWTWLGKRPKWASSEERLLWRTLQAATPADADRLFTQAETIAKTGDASRPATLAWVENRMNLPDRSIPLLELAMSTTDDKELKEKAAGTLLESYLDLGNWERAEAVFEIASSRYTPGERPDVYGRIAVLAAKAGAKQDAMRLWRQAANLDLTETKHLQPMARAGMRDELVAFYQALQQDLPESQIPPRLLVELRDR